MALGLSSVLAGRGGIRTGSRRAAATNQVSASAIRAQPAPTVTTRRAPTVGPEDVQAAPHQGVQRVGLLELLARDQLRA